MGQFKSIFDCTFQFIWLLTPSGIMIEANRTALNFIGRRLKDVTNMPFWETPWWAGNEERTNKLRDAIAIAARGEFVRYETELDEAGTIKMTVDFSIKPIFSDDGQVKMLIPEARDITEQKEYENALQESEAKFKKIFTAVP